MGRVDRLYYSIIMAFRMEFGENFGGDHRFECYCRHVIISFSSQLLYN